MTLWVLNFAVLSGSLSMFSAGVSFGWTSPTTIEFETNSDSEDTSGTMSLMFYGCGMGCIISIILVDVIGRKNTLLLATMPSVAGWLLIGFSKSLMELYVARFLVGISNGLSTVTLPMYIAEIAPIERRGWMTAFASFMKCVGVIYSFSVIPFLSMRNFAFTSLIYPILFVVTFAWSPQTPYYLIHVDRVDAARISLEKLRNRKNVAMELEAVKSATSETFNSEFKVRNSTSTTVTGNRRIITLGFILMLISATSGEVVIINNAKKLFDMIKNNLMEGKYLSIILSFSELVSLFICSILVDRVGRKPLLLVSTLGVSISSIYIGCYYYLQDSNYFVEYLSWTATLGLISYIIFAGLGLVSIPFIFLSEIFPLHLKAACTGLTLAMYYFYVLITLTLFSSIINNFQAYGTFWILAALNLVSSFFVITSVPETKLKTLAEISSHFHVDNWMFRKRGFVMKQCI